MTRHRDFEADLRELFVENHRRNGNLATPFGRHRATGGTPVKPLPLSTGQRVKFLDDRFWWTVQALSPRHVALTRRAAFGGDPLYTVIAWDQGRRGPHNSWGYGAVSREECEQVVAAMDAGEIELSERRAIYLDIDKIEDHR